MITKEEALSKLKNENELLKAIENQIDSAIENWNGTEISVSPPLYTKLILELLAEKYKAAGWTVKVSYTTSGEGYGECDTYYIKLS